MLSTWLILLTATMLQSGGAFPSDLEVLQVAVQRGVSGNLPWELVPESLAVVEDGPEHPFGWVVRRRLEALLLAQGRRVFDTPSGALRAELRFRIGRIRFEHRKESDFFGFSPRVHRRLELDVSVVLRSEDGQVLWLGDLKGGYDDRIPLSRRPDVWVEGLSPQLVEGPGGGFGRALLATAVVGGIIYLLYTGGK